MSNSSTHCFALAALSGILLTLCFPNFSLGFLAWLALVPLLIAVQGCVSERRVILCGALTGLIFFGITLHWLIYVTAFGWVFVTCLETLAIMLFCWSVRRGFVFKNDFLRVFWMALAWTTAELIRSEMPVFGLGWNLLAYSQSDYPWILQSANAVGAYGLGFAIALVNACAFQIILKAKDRGPKAEGVKNGFFKSSVFGLLFSVTIIFSLLLTYGYYHFNRKSSPKGSIRVSVIQGNIPQDLKWEVMARDKILELYTKLTELASFEQPDLIIWPEAAFPGYFNRDSEAEKVSELVKRIQKPLVIGSPHFETWEIAFNSAYLLGLDAAVEGRYDKLYLVPFGEYVPLKPIFGWLEPLAYTLGVSDFTAGKEYTVFKLSKSQNDKIFFSILICFEDVFPNLARNFVDRGAMFLAVMTNDAWFGRSAAPYQHLQASIFRAVENGVPVVRAANTGVSAFISKKGTVLDRVQDEKGKDIFVFGKKTLTIPLEKGQTLYRQGGYLFPYAAFVLFGTILVVRQLNKKTLMLIFCIWFFSSGCIRIVGKAGVWHKGAENGAPKVKQVGFDTQDIVQRDKAPGSITV